LRSFFGRDGTVLTESPRDTKTQSYSSDDVSGRRPNLNLHSMPKLQNNTERALVACSLWLHIGFIGASALAVGLHQLFDGERGGRLRWPWLSSGVCWRQRVGAVVWLSSNVPTETCRRYRCTAHRRRSVPALRQHSKNRAKCGAAMRDEAR
jgi:hypothetical protein